MGSYYSELNEKYGIVDRFRHLAKRMQDIINGCGMQDHVVLDEDLLGKALVDYFEDVDRLKKFEGMERINVSKIYAYEAYWLMRRKPIQTKGTSHDEKCLYINEIVCASMIVSKMFREKGIVPEAGNPDVKRFFDLLYYNLKYRQYTQKSLELAIEAFFLGCSLGK